MTARPGVTSVSQDTRDEVSAASKASRTASEIASATLSVWPSVTDSDVKRQRSDTQGSPLGSERKKECPTPCCRALDRRWRAPERKRVSESPATHHRGPAHRR